MSSYDSAWDMTMQQQLTEVHEDADSLLRKMSVEKIPVQNYMSQTLPRKGGESQQTPYFPVSKHALKSEERKSFAWSLQFNVGSIEHSLVPQTFAADLDLDGNGILESAEIANSLGTDSRDNSDILVSSIDMNGNGAVEYSEFDNFVQQEIQLLGVI